MGQCDTAGESELPSPVNFLSSVGPETRVARSAVSERGPNCMAGRREMGRNGVGQEVRP